MTAADTASAGPVFFVIGEVVTGEKRTCAVAEEIAIYVVVATVECPTVEPPPFFGRTEEELRAAPRQTWTR